LLAVLAACTGGAAMTAEQIGVITPYRKQVRTYGQWTLATAPTIWRTPQLSIAGSCQKVARVHRL